jgi:ribose transport system permease protein
MAATMQKEMTGQASMVPSRLPGTQAVARRTGRWLLRTQEGVLLLTVVALCIFLSFQSKVFLTPRNIGVLLSVVSMTAITAYAMTMLMIAGEVDLSVGSMQAFVGVLVMQVLNQSSSLPLGIVVGLALGAIVGLINAGVTLKLGINSLIVTLAMLNIVRGAGYVATQAAVQNFHKLPSFAEIGNGFVGFVPWPVAIMVIIFAIMYLVMSRTTFGRYIYVVGGNPQAARLAGVRVQWVKTAAFVLTGVSAALSAILLTSRMNSGQNNAGVGFELQVVGAVLLGGTGLGGGAGSLVGTFLAVLLLAILNNGIILLGINSNWQTAVNGLLITLAVYLDARRRHAIGLD